MKDTIVSLALILVIALTGWYTFGSYVHNKKQSRVTIPSVGVYGYRCGDGTEFTVAPSPGGETIHITPTTRIERIPDAVLEKVASESGSRYEGAGIVFHARRERAELSSVEFKTTCLPMQKMDEAPFSFED